MQHLICSRHTTRHATATAAAHANGSCTCNCSSGKEYHVRRLQLLPDFCWADVQHQLHRCLQGLEVLLRDKAGQGAWCGSLHARACEPETGCHCLVLKSMCVSEVSGDCARIGPDEAAEGKAHCRRHAGAMSHDCHAASKLCVTLHVTTGHTVVCQPAVQHCNMADTWILCQVPCHAAAAACLYVHALTAFIFVLLASWNAV